ncbi:MAG: amidohydrolase family protein [Longimicrobiales bacterium]
MTKLRKLLSPLFVASIFVALALGLVVDLTLPASASAAQEVTALVGARIWDGTGAPAISDGIMLVRDGRITYVGERGAVPVPAGATVVNLRGRTIIPGLINTHGHVGGTLGLGGGQYNRPNLIRQLRLYAEYGITTVNSLGGDEQEGVDLRDEQAVVGLDRARIFVAGAVVTGNTVDAALAVVQRNADMGVDWMKLRVDDNLGASQKMSPEIYSAVIDRSHELGLRLASHLFYLSDAKALLRAETDFLAHSIRDMRVDDEFLGMLAQSGICYTPTLTREVSTYVYETRPDFFDDPFFLSHADPVVLEQLQEPDRQARYARAQPYKAALSMALRNLKTISDAGLPVVMGTDTGPAARFQGYFEHMELDLMAEAGLTPEQILRASTGVAAECLRLDDEIGTLRPNRWADFIVLTENPLDDIRNARSIESVWIAGAALR